MTMLSPPPTVAAPRMSRNAAFVAVAAIFMLFMAASSAPSPLYVVYQAQWDFSPTVLTAIFAVYVFGLLGALLVVGSLSDHVGRRPVLLGAILLEAVALALFLVARDVSAIIAARVLQGFATGAAMSTLGAALVDLNPSHAPGRAGLVNSVVPLAGLAIGSLICGALVEFGPSPTHLVWALLLIGMIVAGIVAAVMSEPTVPRPGARNSLIPRVSVPPRLRPQVYVLIPVMMASWATGGLYLSLGPSVAKGVFGLESHLIGGIVVMLLTGTGSIAAFALRGWQSARLLRTSALWLAAGLLISLVAVELDVALLAAFGTVVAGVGFGASGLATFGAMGEMAEAHERGELFAVAFVIAYLGFSIPALIAGVATTEFGLRPTAMVYGLVVVAISVIALLLQRRRAEPTPATSAA